MGLLAVVYRCPCVGFRTVWHLMCTDIQFNLRLHFQIYMGFVVRPVCLDQVKNC